MVVVFPATNDMCIIRNPKTLKENAKFNTAIPKEFMNKTIKDHELQLDQSICERNL